MDIQLKKKPWFVRHKYYVSGGIVFLSLAAYTLGLAEAVQADFLEYVEQEGVVQPMLSLRVNSRISGYVERIVAEEGARVRQGDTLLVLSNPELLDEMEVQENALHKQLMSYREQEIEMEQKTLLLRKQVLQNRYELQRISDSYALSQEEFRMGIKWLVVRAPLTGQLSNLTVVPGQQVQAGGEIGEVKVLDRYKVRVTPGEYYIDRIVSGLPAKGTYKGKPYVMSVRRVVPEVKDRMFTVDLAFTGEVPPSLRLGQALRVQIELGNPERVLTIPRGDFYSVTGGQWIYKVVPGENRAVRTFIRLGRQNPKQYEVLEGLRPSDRVITSGYSRYGDVEELAWDE